MATWRPRFPLTGSGCRCVPQASSSASAAGSLAPLYFRISRPSVTSVYIHEHIAYTIYAQEKRSPDPTSVITPAPSPLPPGAWAHIAFVLPNPKRQKVLPPPKRRFRRDGDGAVRTHDY